MKIKLIGFSLILMTLSVICFAQQEISGMQSGILGPGNYLVVGDIQVNAEDSLTILPNTKFVHTGSYKWQIYGGFSAQGTQNDSIYFIGDGNTMWSGLQFSNNPSTIKFDYCVVDSCYLEYSEDILAGINIIGATGVSLKHSRISDCYSWNSGSGVFISNSVALIDGCKMINNVTVNHLKGPGIYLYHCGESSILNSIIAFNHSDGGG